MASFIREEDGGTHLIIDGHDGIDPPSLDDDNIDLVSCHYYPGRGYGFPQQLEEDVRVSQSEVDSNLDGLPGMNAWVHVSVPVDGGPARRARGRSRCWSASSASSASAAWRRCSRPWRNWPFMKKVRSLTAPA